MRHCTIDTETTGMDQVEDRLVEIGMVWDNGAWGHSLVDPGDRPISFGAMATHHITHADLADAPGVQEALGRCGYAPEDETDTVLVFHNAAYDRDFLPPLMYDNPYICTYRCALHLIPEAESHSNGSLWYELELDRQMPEEAGRMPHRALFDALMTADILEWMISEVASRSKDLEGIGYDCSEDEVIRELIDMTQRPALLKKCRFGKYRDQLWEKIDTGYMKWCLNQDFDADVIHTCNHWIGERR